MGPGYFPTLLSFLIMAIGAVVVFKGVTVEGSPIEPLQLRPIAFILASILVFGFLIAAISCRQGFYASGGARGVGVATTRAVVQSAVAILVANYVLTSWLTVD